MIDNPSFVYAKYKQKKGELQLEFPPILNYKVLSNILLGTLVTSPLTPITPAEAITLTGLEAKVAGVKVWLHLRGQRCSHEHLCTIWTVVP
tara:strand:+ start:473 stop:745 length:273 start_codon:yes stop_codon:yes gene_type:complete